MTKKNLKKSQVKSATHVTGAEQCTKSTSMGTSSSPTLKVLNDLYLVETDPPKKYEGSLEIPDAYKAFYENLPETGVIVSRGPNTKLQLEIGIQVRFGKHSGQRLKHNGKDLQLIREIDILATIT